MAVICVDSHTNADNFCFRHAHYNLSLVAVFYSLISSFPVVHLINPECSLVCFPSLSEFPFHDTEFPSAIFFPGCRVKGFCGKKCNLKNGLVSFRSSPHMQPSDGHSWSTQNVGEDDTHVNNSWINTADNIKGKHENAQHDIYSFPKGTFVWTNHLFSYTNETITSLLSTCVS